MTFISNFFTKSCMDYKRPGNIMVIDGDEISNSIVRISIKQVCKTTRVTICLTAREAITSLFLINEESGILPEFIFLELFDPLIKGWEFLELYERLFVETAGISRIIILTLSILKQDIDHALRHGSVNGYMAKPINAGRFRTLFKHHTNRHKFVSLEDCIYFQHPL